MNERERVKAARKALNMTQLEFSKAICISSTYLAGVESGHRRVNDRLIKLISMTFGISEQWLKTGEGAMGGLYWYRASPRARCKSW